ncbi:hypothetical protein [Parafrankia sp. FMc2]|uniref:hypothetical protein n=1 Tax=Parafrankia sp. FMc2 TaxID=3233196 RepID=UPI0034D44646
MKKFDHLLDLPDWYDHEGSHHPFEVARGASIGYWYGQPDWQPRPRTYSPSNVPPSEVYSPERVKGCCATYGFRKGYRFKDNDYKDTQSEEEMRRYGEPRKVHWHNPLTITRGVAIGFAYARNGNNRPDTRHPDVRSCCATFGFGHGYDVGILVFFANSTKREQEPYFAEERRRRNEYGWG